MSWEQNPRAVTFTRQQVEYQQFPEEFFSGADVVIYFGDVWLADITSLQFTLIEPVRPIYGYASYTWDAVKRGTRLIQGRFSIAFREAGYLYRVLDHIGQLGGRVAPTLAHLLAGESGVPQWHADALQTIEELLDGGVGPPPQRPRFVLLSPGDYEEVPAGIAVMWARELAQRLGVSADWDETRQVVLIGGKAFTPLRVENGRAYVSIREVGEALGYEVQWDGATGNITVSSRGGWRTVATISKNEYTVVDGGVSIMWSRALAERLGVPVDWDDARQVVIIGGQEFTPYKVENGRSYVRIRQVAEALGFRVQWDSATGLISIQDAEKRQITVIRPGEYTMATVPGGRAVMWARDLGQRLGLPVDWDSTRQRVLFGSKEFAPFKVENGRAYVYVRQVAEAFGYTVFWNRNTRYILLVPSGGMLLTPDRFVVLPGQDRAVMPARAVCALVGANPGEPEEFKIADDGVYYFGRRFERVDGVFPGEPGVYVREVLQSFNRAVEWVKEAECIILSPPEASGTAAQQQQGTNRFVKSMNDYEKEVWGDPFVEERSQHRQFVPYFYSGPNMAPLQKYGFDIYIVYGPLPYHVKERLNVLPDLITYSTTVKAIRNVQLTGCSQVLDPTGRPVEEVYEFIARDMD